MTGRLRIVVSGLIAQFPLGGVAWDYLQYVLGLARLGHDVYYLEDTGNWPWSPVRGEPTPDPAFNLAYLERVMARFDLGDRWAWCAWAGDDVSAPWGPRWYGLDPRRREEVLGTADLLVNVSGSLAFPERYRAARRMAYVDSDPVFTQVKMAAGDAELRARADLHDVHFSFGETLGPPVPDTGHRWRPTRQPVVLEAWATTLAPRPVFTTVMNWTSYEPLVWKGRHYGQKDEEFLRFVDLPRRVGPAALEIAVNVGVTAHAPRERLAGHGWRVVHPDDVCPDLDGYRAYVQASRAEWSVAKSGYVRGACGWFSCRSACYLAAGRPVVVQDTGFSRVLPVGEGILPFGTLEEAVDAVRRVTRDWGRHARAARTVARECFDAAVVLRRLLEDAG